MLNPNAPPFEYHVSSSYNYCYYQVPPLVSYYQSTAYLSSDHLESTSTQDPLRSSFEFEGSGLDADEGRTTLMIKNIPNKLSRDMLISMLDQHCAQENYKAAMEGSPLSEYDFVYLPMDFVNKCNLGYAFVNFTTSLAGWRMFRVMHHCKWTVFHSKKISHICYARIQGKEALLQNFRKSCFCCDDKSYLPAVLSPPRNGTTSLTEPAAVGKIKLP